ncbi:pyridoxal phosphate-dependent aminotransferase [Roseburia sp. AM23-20]|jgi:cystathionine beta-lyase|uniref:MalY/PatB family protein n=1 Tax=Roseburia sp. AM23-20 TaxID=2292066 RepID=UPI000E4BF380|nr:pyridoxal phosphate-dependent aminotransferase [Roseburia sp. AM23-20]
MEYVMKYDFDEVVERRGTGCLKYDFAKERGKKEDVLPLWVADMDFKTVPAVTKRLQKAVEHGIYGYSDSKEDYFAAVSGWYRDHFDWNTKQEWMIKTPGVVFALAAAVRAYTEKGDAVLIQQPVYYPFRQVIESNDRKLVSSDLVLRDGHYEIDFENFEAKIKEHQIHLFLLCSPHNPVGRVWKEWELRKIGEICLKYQVVVVSDEIHSDFVYPGNKHYVFASIEPEFEKISVICTAPSKTFNLAGLQVSNIFIADEGLRKKFIRAVDQAGYSQVNLMGLVACQAAYEEGAEWLLQLKEYLLENLSFVREYLKENLPEVKLIEPEGTYLIWLDFEALGLERKELEALIDKAGLWLDAGTIFGKTGIGFERINIACPRRTLEQAFVQLKKAVDQLK